MSGVLVFDDQADVLAQGSESERALVVLDATEDVLVFDAPTDRQLEDAADPSTDFLIFDSQATVTQTVESLTDFLLVDTPKPETRVVMEGDEDEDLLVVTAGGPPGTPGSPGPQGPPGPIGSEPDLVDLTLLFENGLI